MQTWQYVMYRFFRVEKNSCYAQRSMNKQFFQKVQPAGCHFLAQKHALCDVSPSYLEDHPSDRKSLITN